jgi:hypothetical protein
MSTLFLKGMLVVGIGISAAVACSPKSIAKIGVALR